MSHALIKQGRKGKETWIHGDSIDLRFTPRTKACMGKKQKEFKFKKQTHRRARNHHHTISYRETGLRETTDSRYI